MADHIDLRAVDPFYKVRFDDGEVFSYSADLEQMRLEVARISPGDVAGFERYLQASAEIYRSWGVGRMSVPMQTYDRSPTERALSKAQPRVPSD